jgi:tRNA A-37 threonylcarbamoyl transferase component Bud32
MLEINQWLSLDNQGNTSNEKHSLEHTVDMTQEFATWILNNNVSSNVKNAILNNSEELELFILDYISNHQSITWGQEWEVYIVNIEWKEIILAKKRYDNESKREYNLHKEAYNISKLSQSWVKVPEPIYEFNDWVNWYIVMEYIEWKTLYTKTWEAIINQHLIPYLKKYILHEKQDYMAAECDLHDLSQKYWKDNQITFNNDTQAEEWVIEYIEILYKLRIIDNNPNITTKDINRPHIRKNIALENYYKKHIGNTVVFNTSDWSKFAEQIKLFITDLHDNWMYHRDLWGNPRNIMFTEDEVFIIDFWKSEIWVWKWNYSNIDQISWWIYDDDEWIIHKIKWLTWKFKQDSVNINNEQRNRNIIKKWAGLWLSITQNNIKLYESHIKSINLNKYIDDLVNNKDSSYNWFIYLSEKWADLEWKKKSNNIWKPKLFILLSLLKKEELLQIINKLEEIKSTSKSKASRWYKYAVFITNYINRIIE